MLTQLKQLLELRKQRAIKAWRGKLQWDDELDAMRTDLTKVYEGVDPRITIKEIDDALKAIRRLRLKKLL